MPCVSNLQDIFYKNIENHAAIRTLLESYEIEKCMEDLEFFTEFSSELPDEYPHVPNLQVVLERMLIQRLN